MLHNKLVIAALISGCSLSAISSSVSAQNAANEAAQNETQNYDIPAQSLDTALSAFTETSGSDLLYSSELVDGKVSSRVNGTFTPSDALRQLLRRTGLRAAQVSEGVYSLQEQSGSASAEAAISPVRGIVRSQSTGNGLAGAKVEVVGTRLRTATDDRGYFSFPEVDIEAAQLRISYLGEPDSVFDLPDRTFARTRLNIVFGEQLEANDILVVGYLSSIQKSLNQQLRAPNNSTIVSADQLGGFPAETISEALRRVPGVGFGRDDETGEGSRITVRGFSSEAINIQLNGIEQQGTSFGRTVDLSGFLTENLASVTIHKSLLPSHEASGSGGLVEIETKSALDYDDFDLNLNIEGELSPDRDFGEEYQLNGILATKLTDNLAVVGTVQYRDTNRTNVDSTLVDVVPPVLPEGFLFLSRVPASFDFPFDPELSQRLIASTNFVQRDRDETAFNASLGFAWDVADHTRLRLDLQRNVRDVVGATTNNSFVATTPIVNMPVAEVGGEVRRREVLSNFRPNISVNTLNNKLTSDTISFRGDTDIGRWEFEYRAGYTRARSEGNNALVNLQGSLNTDIFNLISPDTIVTAPDTLGNPRVVDGLFTLAPNGVALPSLSAAGLAAVVDPSQYNILIASRNLIDNTTESFNFELQTRYKPATDFIEYIEVGGLYRPTTRKTIDDTTNPRASLIESYVRRFGQELAIGDIEGAIIGQDDLGIIGIPNFQIGTLSPNVFPTIFETLRNIGDTRYISNDQRGLDPFENPGALQPTETSEDRLAAYLETQINFGKFDLIAGVRYEKESRSNVTIAAPSIQFANGVGGSEPRETFLDAGLITFDEVSGSVDNWTPSFLLNYRPASNIVARLGYFRSTVNPDLRLLNRTQRIRGDLRPNIAQVTLSIPNPDLKPTITDNIDLDVAYYFEDSVGLVRAGFFYKNVKNNFTNVIFENGDGGGIDVRAAYEDFFAPLRDTRPDLFDFPVGTEFLLNQPVNGEGGEIYGFEFELVRELDFLPGFLSDFGVLANATYTTADFPTLVSARNDDGELIQLALDRPLRDQPRWVYNLSLNYNRNGFEGLVIYTDQSATAERFDEFNINQVVPPFNTLDARLAYTFEKGRGTYSVYLEGDNLLRGGQDAEIRSATSSQFGNGSANFNFPDRFQFNGGRTITAGIRARF